MRAGTKAFIVALIILSVPFSSPVFSHSLELNEAKRTDNICAIKYGFGGKYENINIDRNIVSDLIACKNVYEQIKILSSYGIISNEECIILKMMPAIFSIVSYGIIFPPVPLPLVLLLYGYIFHLFPAMIFLLSIVLKIINFLFPPPLPKISTGFYLPIVLAENYLHIITKEENVKDTYFGPLGLLVFGFIGWIIYIPFIIFTDFAFEIFGIPIPIPFGVIICIGASLSLRLIW